MAQKRLNLLTGIPLLDIDEQTADLADELIQNAILPPLAAQDAIYIAVSAVHRMQFLLTWNCKHIANPRIQERIRACFLRQGVAFLLSALQRSSSAMKTSTIHPPEASADIVIREVRHVKERLARMHGFDVRRIAAAARAKQHQSGHIVVSRSK